SECSVLLHSVGRGAVFAPTVAFASSEVRPRRVSTRLEAEGETEKHSSFLVIHVGSATFGGGRSIVMPSTLTFPKPSNLYWKFRVHEFKTTPHVRWRYLGAEHHQLCIDPETARGSARSERSRGAAD